MGEAPVPGQVLELEIGALAAGGEGVGRHQGMAVFVADAAAGDRARVRVTRAHRGWARASLLEVLRASPSRVQPRCRLAGRCGGCQLQHLAYDAQVEFKRQAVQDALARIGGLREVPVRPCLPAPAAWGYRNKAQFPTAAIRHGRDWRLAAGIYARGSHDVVEVEDCPVQHPTNNRVLRETVAVARDRGIVPYDEDTGRGLLRHILVRVGVRTGEAMVVLVTSSPQLPGARALAGELMARAPELVCLAQNVNPRRTNVILGEHTRIVAGKPSITDCLGPFRFRISPGSFFQVNTAQAEALCRLATELADPGPADTVVEVYAGTGTITLFLAEKAGLVVGVEAHRQAVEDARRNAAASGVRNARFQAGLAESVLPELARSGLRAGAVVVDPPRKGCAPRVLQAVADLRPPRVVYVSCDPATLARDLAVLAGRGYRPVEVAPLDMFPMTAHVEAVALLASSA